METEMEILGELAKQLQKAEDIMHRRLGKSEPLRSGELGSLVGILTDTRIVIERIVQRAEVGK